MQTSLTPLPRVKLPLIDSLSKRDSGIALSPKHDPFRSIHSHRVYTVNVENQRMFHPRQPEPPQDPKSRNAKAQMFRVLSKPDIIHSSTDSDQKVPRTHRHSQKFHQRDLTGKNGQMLSLEYGKKSSHEKQKSPFASMTLTPKNKEKEEKRNKRPFRNIQIKHVFKEISINRDHSLKEQQPQPPS